MSNPIKPTNAQDKIIEFTVSELTRVLKDLKAGREPKMSKQMEKLADAMEQVSDSNTKMSEEQIKEWTEKLSEEILNKDKK